MLVALRFFFVSHTAFHQPLMTLQLQMFCYSYSTEAETHFLKKLAYPASRMITRFLESETKPNLLIAEQSE